jgi:hypothetical protein
VADESPSGLRYSDGPETATDVLVRASADVVWPLVCDINLPSRFSSEFLGATWLDGADHPSPGARFLGRNRHSAIGEWQTTSTVVGLEPERELSWAVSDPVTPSSRWWITLEPEGTATRLRMRMRMGPAPSGISRAIEAMPDKEDRILRRRLGELRANMEATLGGIKALAES